MDHTGAHMFGPENKLKFHSHTYTESTHIQHTMFGPHMCPHVSTCAHTCPQALRNKAGRVHMCPHVSTRAHMHFGAKRAVLALVDGY